MSPAFLLNNVNPYFLNFKRINLQPYELSYCFMKFRTLFFITISFLLALGSCSKDNFDAEKQAQIDDAIIVKYLTANNIPAQKHESGIYYEISSEGNGSVTYSQNTTISARYTGRFLNGGVFDQTSSSPVSFLLGQVIAGWQIGIPLIQKGGKIRLIIPSGYAYGPRGDISGTIPPNTVLDFEIVLDDVQN